MLLLCFFDVAKLFSDTVWILRPPPFPPPFIRFYILYSKNQRWFLCPYICCLYNTTTSHLRERRPRPGHDNVTYASKYVFKYYYYYFISDGDVLICRASVFFYFFYLPTGQPPRARVCRYHIIYRKNSFGTRREDGRGTQMLLDRRSIIVGCECVYYTNAPRDLRHSCRRQTYNTFQTFSDGACDVFTFVIPYCAWGHCNRRHLFS